MAGDGLDVVGLEPSVLLLDAGAEEPLNLPQTERDGPQFVARIRFGGRWLVSGLGPVVHG